MDSKAKKVKTPIFQEGHKRETRKSYQAYLDEITHSADDPTMSGDTSEDSSIRRSKRTPIPKRGFKLIDTYTTKKKKEESSPSKSKHRKSLENTESEDGLDTSQETVSQSTEDSEKEEVSAPSRRSGRPRKPKKFDDSITPGKNKKSKPVPELDEKPAINKKVNQSPSKKPSLKNQPAESIKKPGRKRQPSKEKITDEIVPVKKKKSCSNSQDVIIPKEEAVEETKQEKENGEEGGGESMAGLGSEATPYNDGHLGEVLSEAVETKPNEINDSYMLAENLSIKEEQHLDKDEVLPKNYESFVYSNTESFSAEEKNEECDVKPIKLTFKTSVEDKVKVKKKKRSSQEKHESKRKNPEKLFVSFKKKEKKKHNKSFEDVQEQLVVAEEPVAEEEGVMAAISNEEVIIETPEIVIPSQLVEEVVEKVEKEHHKKSKKKKKKKEESKVNKMVDVQTYAVSDTNIVRVKKKKIFKRRNGEKVLVRITKNHCNKNDEIVKSETVIVDNVPVKDDLMPMFKQECLDVPNQNIEIQSSSDMLDESINNNSDHSKSGDDDEFSNPKEKNDVNKKMNLQKKKPFIKKVINKVIKKTSRPANKNVTVGGKVVGKTTKGMKKTGAAAMKKTGNAILDMVRERQAQNAAAAAAMVEVTHIEHGVDFAAGKMTPTEPKNAYNLFCRKYRPIIVQSHPKADFAEISKRLACLWNMASDSEKQEHRDRFLEMQSGTKIRLNKLNRTSPSLWADKEFDFIKNAIQRDVEFTIPKYSVKRLEPVDMAAHFQLLGDSLNVIAGALQQQSGMTVHGTMSLLLDSILCGIAPLLCLTSHVPQMNAISTDQQARILDNVAYILPGL